MQESLSKVRDGVSKVRQPSSSMFQKPTVTLNGKGKTPEIRKIG